MSITADITSREDLLDLLRQLDDREAIEFAAAEPPADHVRPIPVRTLVAEAPALPLLKFPKLTERNLNGARIDDLIEAGRSAALVLTTDGVRIEKQLAEVDETDEVIVLAVWREVAKRVTVQGVKSSTVAREILHREQKAQRLLEAA